MDELLDFDLDFLGQQSSAEAEEDNFDMRQLAQRIAETDGLVRTVKSLEAENQVLKKKLLDLNQSANEVQSMYSKEYAKANDLGSKNVELSDRLKTAQGKIVLLEAESVQKNLYYDQLEEEGKRNVEDEKSRHDQLEKRYKELCEKFIQQAKLLSDKGMLDIASKKDITEIKRYLHKNNIEFTAFTSPKKRDSNSVSRMVSRGTQYTTSTTTRSACTSAFIKKHNVGTNFPEVVPISIEDIFHETLIDLPSPVTPICDSPTFTISVGSQTNFDLPVKTTASVEICTDLCNVQKEIGFTSNQLQLGRLVKRETLTDGKSLPQLSDLWSLLGHTIFALIGDGSSGISSVNLEDFRQQMALLTKSEDINAINLQDKNELENNVTKIETNNSTCSSPLPGEFNAPRSPSQTTIGTMSNDIETSSAPSIYVDNNNHFECLETNASSSSLDLNDSLSKNGNSNQPHTEFIFEKMIENSSYTHSDLIDFTNEMKMLGKKLISPIRDPVSSKNVLTKETFSQTHPVSNNEQKIQKATENCVKSVTELNTYKSLESVSSSNLVVTDNEASTTNSSSTIHFGNGTDTTNLNEEPCLNIKPESALLKRKKILFIAEERPRMEKYENVAESAIVNILHIPIAISESHTATVKDSIAPTSSRNYNNEIHKSIEKQLLPNNEAFKVNCESRTITDIAPLSPLKHIEETNLKTCKPEIDGTELTESISTAVLNPGNLLESSFVDLQNKQEEQTCITVSSCKSSIMKFNKCSRYKEILSGNLIPEQVRPNIDSAKETANIQITNNRLSLQSCQKLECAEKQIEINHAAQSMPLVLNDPGKKHSKKTAQRARKRLRKQQNQNSIVQSKNKTETNNENFDTNTSDDEVLLKKVKTSIVFPDFIEPIPELSTKQLQEFYSNNKSDQFSEEEEEDFHGFTKEEIEGNSMEISNYLDSSPLSPNMQDEPCDSYNTIEIPLERTPEYDSDYSPASPRRETLSTEIRDPVVIPLNRAGYKICSRATKLPKSILGRYIAKYDNTKRKLFIQKSRPETIAEAKLLGMLRKIIERYLMSTANKIECEKCARRIVKRTVQQRPLIIKAIIEIVEDTNEEISNSLTPPATIMTESHQKILVLVKKLNQYIEGFDRRLLFTLDQQIFNLKTDTLKLEVLVNLTILYISLIDTLNLNKNSARLFIYKCLYYYNKMCIPMIYLILTAYPGILPGKKDIEYDRSDPLISTIQSILNSQQYDMNSGDLKHREVFHMLQMFYEYERVKPSREEVIENLLLKIRADKFRNVSYCFALLCKRGGVKWCVNYVINDRLIPILREYSNYLLETDIHDRKVACLLDCISYALKPLPAASDVRNYQQIFISILYKTDRKIVQESSFAAIFRTSRFNYVDCFNLIYRWNPSYKISNSVRLMILSFIHRFTLKTLVNLENQI